MEEEKKEEVKPAKPEPKELTTTQLEALDWLAGRLDELVHTETAEHSQPIRDSIAAAKDFLDAFKEYDVKLEQPPEGEEGNG